tara:strand:- start:373 stop:948 length:576 start_codon:yes stop_codon:yes gene_type:complete
MYKCKKCDFVAKTEVGLRKHENRKIPCDAKKTKTKQKTEEEKKIEDEEICKDCPKQEQHFNLDDDEDDDFMDERLGSIFLDECDQLFKLTRDTHGDFFKKMDEKYTKMDQQDDFKSIINSIISLSNQGIWFMCRCYLIHRIAIEKHTRLDGKEVRKLLIKNMFKTEIEGILNEILGSNIFTNEQQAQIHVD